MNEAVWELPQPSTGFINEPELDFLGRRSCRISFAYEATDGSAIPAAICFRHVFAVRVTYGQLCTAEIIKAAYDALVEFKPSEWLRQERDAENITSARHFGIYFDDGPFYEVLCESVDLPQPSSIPLMKT